MHKTTTDNYIKLHLYLFYVPVILVALGILFLYITRSLNIGSYIQLQTPLFFLINSKLSQYPSVQYNLTQLGDALVFLSFLTILIVYAPKVWGGINNCFNNFSSILYPYKNFICGTKTSCGF